MPETYSADAPAKVNLVLEVLGRRPDGYHEIDTVMQTLELADRVRLKLAGAADSLEITGRFAADTSAARDNLALKAVAEIRRLVDLPPVAVRIEKRIPVAAGLGGGASDAATVLRLLQRAAPGISDEQLMEAATAIGSDVAFFLVGGTARATGRGECVEPLAPMQRHDVVIFAPFTVLPDKTRGMFQRLDDQPFDRGGRAAAFAASMMEEVSCEGLYNAFERVAFDAVPGLGRLRATIEETVPGGAIRLAGAGPAMFWIGPRSGALGVAGRGVGFACDVLVTRTASSLWRP